MTGPAPMASTRNHKPGRHAQRRSAAQAPLPAQPWYATSIRDLRRSSLRAQVIFATVVGLLVVMTLGVVASLVESDRASDFSDDLNTTYCEDMDYTPAECAQ